MTGDYCPAGAFDAVGYIDDEWGVAPLKCTATRVACGVFLSAAHCGAVDPDGSKYVTDFVDRQGNETHLTDYAFIDGASWEGNWHGLVFDVALYFGKERCEPALPVAQLPTVPGQPDLTQLTALGFGTFYHDGVCVEDGYCRFAHTSGYANANELIVHHSSGHGDSGGPVFLGFVDSVDASPTVLGVLSHSPEGCAAPPSTYTNLSWAGDESHPGPVAWILAELDQRDSDDDGLLDHVDNCPQLNTANTVDSDGDGVGDACDDCPCDPNESNPWKDEDKDGICGWCDGTLKNQDGSTNACTAKCGGVKKPIDACPGVAGSILAANCNNAAEQARGARVMTNECDPVPCPDFLATHNENVVPIAYAAFADGYVVGHTATYQSELSPLSVHPIGSHGAPELTDAAKRGVEITVVPQWTEYRYCVHRMPDVDCTAPANIQDALIREAASRLQEQRESVWHRVWLAESRFPGEPFPNGSGTIGTSNPIDILTYDSTRSPRTRTWNWDRDFTYWHARWSGYPASPTLPPSGSDNPGGRFLAHAETTVGMTPAEQNPYGTGVHGMASDYATPGDSLANHLSYVWPVKRTTTTTFDRVPQWDAGFVARLCINCPVLVPIEEPDTCDHCGALLDAPNMSVDEAQQLVLIQTATGTLPAVLLHDGSVMTLENSVGTHLAESLASGYSWVSAAEPDPMSGRGASEPAALGLSADGTEVTEKVYLSHHRAYGRGDCGDRIDCGDASAVGIASLEQSESETPPAREAFEAVYSRSSGRLFVLGGQDATTHDPNHDIWWRDVAGGSWRKTPLSPWQPQRVLAATWSPVDERLWVVEDTDSGSQRRERIVRVRPGTGEAEVLGSWPRGGLFDRHWLVVDRDGGILVVASSSRPKKHVVVRIAVDPDESVHVEGIRVAQGTLAMAPVVDGEGYSFAIATGPTTLPRIERVADLGRKHGPWSDVGQCF